MYMGEIFEARFELNSEDSFCLSQYRISGKLNGKKVCPSFPKFMSFIDSDIMIRTNSGNSYLLIDKKDDVEFVAELKRVIEHNGYFTKG